MLITRATRHDRSDLAELYEGHGWNEVDLAEGVAFIARDGKIAGAVRIIEVEPQTLVVDDVLVREDKRAGGLGRNLMQAAMNSRGGTMYLCCHEETIPFYAKLGFAQLDRTELPGSVEQYLDKVGDLNPGPDHVHYFLKAR